MTAAARSFELETLPKRIRRWRLTLAALALVLGGVAAGILMVRLAASPKSVLPTRTFPLTTDPGSEFGPAMSPDGLRVAFAATRDNGNDDLFVRLLNSDEPLRLTRNAAADRHPAWSPDGTRIAFVRESEGPL